MAQLEQTVLPNLPLRGRGGLNGVRSLREDGLNQHTIVCPWGTVAMAVPCSYLTRQLGATTDQVLAQTRKHSSKIICEAKEDTPSV